MDVIYHDVSQESGILYIHVKKSEDSHGDDKFKIQSTSSIIQPRIDE